MTLTGAGDWDVDLPVVGDIILFLYHEWHFRSSHAPPPITGCYLSRSYHLIMPIKFSGEATGLRHDTRGFVGLVYVVGDR